jgi:hypothetical protein
LPTGTEGIPDWFQYQSWGHTAVSFWFRKEIPSIKSVILFSDPKPSDDDDDDDYYSDDDDTELRVKLCVNGYEYTLSGNWWMSSESHFRQQSDHTYLFDLKLEKMIKFYNQRYENLMCELDEALLKNEWIQVELQLIEEGPSFNFREEHTQIGIYMLKKKRSTEENVKFTNPYRKRKLDEYLNTSLSQFHTLLNEAKNKGRGSF